MSGQTQGANVLASTRGLRGLSPGEEDGFGRFWEPSASWNRVLLGVGEETGYRKNSLGVDPVPEMVFIT